MPFKLKVVNFQSQSTYYSAIKSLEEESRVQSLTEPISYDESSTKEGVNFLKIFAQCSSTTGHGNNGSKERS